MAKGPGRDRARPSEGAPLRYPKSYSLEPLREPTAELIPVQVECGEGQRLHGVGDGTIKTRHGYFAQSS